MDTAPLKPEPGKILNSIRFLKTMRKQVKSLKFSQGNSTGIKNLTKLIESKQSERLTTKNLPIHTKLVVKHGGSKGSFKPKPKTPAEKIKDVMLKEEAIKQFRLTFKPNRKQKRSYPHEVKRQERVQRLQQINDEKRKQEERSYEIQKEKIICIKKGETLNGNFI